MAARNPNRDQAVDMLRSGHSTAAVQAQFGICKSAVCRWARDAGIARPRYSPFSEKLVPCPFSAARVVEMYYHDGMSLVDIASEAAKLLSRAGLSWAVARRWLVEAGRDPRSANESHKVWARRNPEKAALLGKNMAATFSRAHQSEAGKKSLADPARLKSFRAAGLKKAAEVKRQKSIVVLRCPECDEEFTRRRGDIAAPTKYGRFCGRSCQHRYMGRVKRDLAIRHRAELLEARPCCWPGCPKIMRRRPSQFRGKLSFCCSRHAGLYYANAPR